MGGWERMSSATNLLKRKAPPEVEPAAEAAGKATTLAGNLDGAVRTKARQIHLYLSDDRVRENISRILVDASKNGALHLARSYGVGPVIDIVLQSSAQYRKADSQTERIDELEKRVAKLEKELKSKL